MDHVVAIAATEDKVVLPLSTPQAIGTTFTGRIEEITQIGPYPAIVPTISGQGWITGMANSMIDPTDPLGAGFTVSDLWA
ncbi:proline racemase family protein [Marimonas lutisalis]|uniref:proline racemase family protein n=1 Tax=Marimonas lutisalis TaxID=2545756 RepID=UPI001F43DB48|nr:proline racemase family protein [Marimonas lutisalis]